MNSASLSIQGWRMFGQHGEETTIPLRPLNIITGTNGSGKSSLLRVIKWFASSARNKSLMSVIDEIDHEANSDSKYLKIFLPLTVVDVAARRGLSLLLDLIEAIHRKPDKESNDAYPDDLMHATKKHVAFLLIGNIVLDENTSRIYLNDAINESDDLAEDHPLPEFLDGFDPDSAFRRLFVHFDTRRQSENSYLDILRYCESSGSGRLQNTIERLMEHTLISETILNPESINPNNAPSTGKIALGYRRDSAKWIPDKIQLLISYTENDNGNVALEYYAPEHRLTVNHSELIDAFFPEYHALYEALSFPLRFKEGLYRLVGLQDSVVSPNVESDKIDLRVIGEMILRLKDGDLTCFLSPLQEAPKPDRFVDHSDLSVYEYSIEIMIDKYLKGLRCLFDSSSVKDERDEDVRTQKEGTTVVGSGALRNDDEDLGWGNEHMHGLHTSPDAPLRGYNLLGDQLMKYSSVYHLPAVRSVQSDELLIEQLPDSVGKLMIYLSNTASDSIGNRWLAKWMRTFGFGDDVIFEKFGRLGIKVNIRLQSGQYRSFGSMGYGVSQLVPIMISLAALLNGEGGCAPLVLIEEPESHLHPKAQSMVADMLIDFMKNVQDGGRPVLFVETHSEYLLRRLQLYVAKRDIAPQDLSIVYMGTSKN